MEEQSDETTPQAAPRAGRATGSRMGIALPVKLKHMKSEGPKHNKMALTAKSAPLKRPAPPRTPPPNKLIVQKQKQLQKEKELQKEIAEKQKDTEIQRLRLELQQQKEIAEKQKDTEIAEKQKEMQQLRLELQQQKEATVAAEEEATKQSTASSSLVALTVYSIPRLLEPSFSNFLELSPTFTLTPGAQGYPKGPNFHLNPWGPAHVENAPRRLRAEERFPRS